MAKIPTCALTLAMYLLFNVNDLTVANNTTQHEFNTRNASEETLSQPTTAVTQHNNYSTASTRRERLGNSEINDTSNAVNTTLTTIGQRNVGSLPTALPTKNETDNMTRATRWPATDGNTPGATDGNAPNTRPRKTSAMTLTTIPGATDKSNTKSKSVRNGIIILCAVIGLLLVILLFCFFQQRKKGRNSFNLQRGSPDNAGIPLSSSVAEKNAALNMKEDKIDIHPIQSSENTRAMADSSKPAAASGPADGHEGESNSTASTVPKDDELDKLSLDSSQVSLLPPSTGNLKEQDQAGDSNAAPPTETHTKELNENNNNSSQWAILQLKIGGRVEEPYCALPVSTVTTRSHGNSLSPMERDNLMQDFEEGQGTCAGNLAQKNSFFDILPNREP